MSKYIYTKRSSRRSIVDDDFDMPEGWFLSVTEHGYAVIQKYIPETKGYERKYLHRHISDAPHGVDVDHINGDRLDNRKENLRICSHAQNSRNRKPQPGRKCKGVSFYNRRGLWRAYIVVDGRQKHLGYWDNKLDAMVAYNAGAVIYHGEFARINKF